MSWWPSIQTRAINTTPRYATSGNHVVGCLIQQKMSELTSLHQADVLLPSKGVTPVILYVSSECPHPLDVRLICTGRPSVWTFTADIRYDTQHAYLPGRSTETALAAAVAYITRQVDAQAGRIASLRGSLERLRLCRSRYSASKAGLVWCRLSVVRGLPDWPAAAVRGGTTVQNVTAGVPQDSLTGPILFLVYTNDIPSHLDCNVISYADDSQILLSSKISEIPMMTSRLEQNLRSLETWYRANCLKLNASKTQYVVFCTRQMQRQMPDVALSVGDAVCDPSRLSEKFRSHYGPKPHLGSARK